MCYPSPHPVTLGKMKEVDITMGAISKRRGGGREASRGRDGGSAHVTVLVVRALGRVSSDKQILVL